MKKVFIYNDYGSSEFSVAQLRNSIRTVFPDVYEISVINANEIISGCLTKDFDAHEFRLFCMGGGFDLGYLKSLGSDGIRQIKKFISLGGNYLGICAGAYFACDFIEFDLNGPLEVFGERPLKFFNGKAVGPINKNFKYACEDEAMAVKITLETRQSIEFYAYLNGGCYFEAKESSQFQPVAKYVADNFGGKNAIVVCRTGSSGKCVLSGVHFEFDAFALDLNNFNIQDNLFNKLTEMNKKSNVDLSNLVKSESDSMHSNHFLVKFIFDFFN